MGLGKTIQTIAFLSAVLGKTAGPSDLRRRFPLPPSDAKQAMIVVPVSTLGNWLRELRTWGYFRVATGHGAERESAIAAVRAREVRAPPGTMFRSRRKLSPRVCATGARHPPQPYTAPVLC
jgi:SNF2 family DNA or RNA helicase